MSTDPTNTLPRRRFLDVALLLPAGLTLAARALAAGSATGKGAAAQRDEPVLDPTPPCADDDDVTPSETAGPFFTPNSPKRQSFLAKGVPGTPIVLAGRVFSKSCVPMKNVLVDFWHADGDGEYDNEGYRCRGHQFTDERGVFRLESVVPGLYPGRTRHFHVRVQPSGGRILTTQLYFPGEATNRRDGLFKSELLMNVEPGVKHKLATFDFVLNA